MRVMKRFTTASVRAVRFAVIGAAVFPVAVASASTSRGQGQSVRTSQKAIGVSLPRPQYAVAGFNRVVCPVVGGCVASFSEGGRLAVLRQRGPQWTREATPPGVFLVALACPSPGSCVGSARAPRGTSVYVLTQGRRTW